ncbi:MAG: UDP-galactopyranose mutase [archaeon]|nr:UDP-galactopyranose mutase [archaeon]
MSRILVVGAGLSGSTVANVLSRDPGNSILVVDRRDHIAGNCFDYRDGNGIMVHRYGSHILHTSDGDVWNYLRQFTAFNDYEHRVVAVIGGKEVPLPFNYDSMHMVFERELADRMERKLGERFPEGTKIPILELLRTDDPDLRLLAEFIHENVFLHYTRKQWGRDPSEIDGAVTARVPVMLSRDDRYFQDPFQGIPLQGYTEMVRRMLDRPNVEVRLGIDARDLELDGYDEVYYTGAVDELMDFELGVLPYRSVRFEFETHDLEHYQSHAAVNHPNDHDYTRVHEYKYYLDDRSERTTIAMEYSEDFIPGENEPYYPVVDEGSRRLYDDYVELLHRRHPNVRLLGRLGDFRYYDMDKAVGRALSLARSRDSS